MEISINHPHFPKGTEFDIPGVGVVPNGGTLTLEGEELEQANAVYQGMTGRTLEEAFRPKKKTRSSKDKEGGES